MARIPRPRVHAPGNEEFTAASEAVDEWTKPRPKRQRSASANYTEAKMLAAASKLDDVIARQAWDEARPVEFLVLFMRMYLLIYGTPLVASATDRRNATLMIAGCIRNYFGGDKVKFADFMRWTWRREKRTEKWRRENNQPGRVIGIRLQCSSAFVSDWRVDVERGRG